MNKNIEKFKPDITTEVFENLRPVYINRENEFITVEPEDLPSNPGGGIPTLDEVNGAGNSTNKNMFQYDASFVSTSIIDSYRSLLSRSFLNFFKISTGDQSILDVFKLAILSATGEIMFYDKNSVKHYDPNTEVTNTLDFTNNAVVDRNYIFDPTLSGTLAVKEWVLTYIADIATPQIIVSAATNIIITPTRKVIIVTALEGVSTVTIPTIVGNEGLIILFTNDTIGIVSLISNNGIDTDIWDSKLLVNSKETISGSITRLTNDGVNYKTQ